MVTLDCDCVTGTDLSNSVVLRKPVIVKNCEHQGLVKRVGIGKVLELERFVEERIESFPVNFRLKLLDPFCLRH